jgi:putative ABC transport system permease protein
MNFLHLIYESFRFAMQALKANVFRTILSLLGVTVGIFSIIGVYTMVDSLQKNIEGSLSTLGANTIHIDKWPWAFAGNDFPWWKYFLRPQPRYEEYRYLRDNLKEAQAVSIFTARANITVKNGSNSVQAGIMGVAQEYNIISDVPIADGRWYLQQESEAARNIAILGFEIADNLFPNESPIGKIIKIKGLNFTVIGVQVRQGESIATVGNTPVDQRVFLPFLSFKKVFSSGFATGVISVKGYDTDKDLVQLESEITGLMRTKRALKPSQDNDFELNRSEAIMASIGSIFDGLRVGGFWIGIFSLLIGGFGIANIMFVSVKERTNIIGIQKSLGAKNYFILFQFLFEAVFLCILGGFFGILVVYLASFIQLGSLDIVLTSNNIILGVAIASLIGVISGIVPAWQASRLNPVDAIRSK